MFPFLNGRQLSKSTTGAPSCASVIVNRWSYLPGLHHLKSRKEHSALTSGSLLPLRAILPYRKTVFPTTRPLFLHSNSFVSFCVQFLYFLFRKERYGSPRHLTVLFSFKHNISQLKRRLWDVKRSTTDHNAPTALIILFPATTSKVFTLDLSSWSKFQIHLSPSYFHPSLFPIH